MNWDSHPADRAFFSEPEEPLARGQCCDDPTPAAETDGQRWCEACDSDLCATCNRRVEAGYDDKHCPACWEEGVLSRG